MKNFFENISQSLNEEALFASQELQARITQQIDDAGGWIDFARYMALALYTPQFGYYTGGAHKLGARGDFITAPELTPLFGASLAHTCAAIMQQSTPHILEFGAGSGQLAFDVLTELKRLNIPCLRYTIVELSGELQARQQQRLADFKEVVWLTELPATFSGCILGNEVLDAMPVQLVIKTEQGWCEYGVGLDEQRHFVFAQHPLADTRLLQQIPNAHILPLGYVTEIHSHAIGFTHSIARMLQKGAAVLIDYGFPAHEYYHPERSQNQLPATLMCHLRHHAHANPFFLPGLQDITAHIDFSAIAHAAIEQGCIVSVYTSQAAFLLASGIDALLLRTAPESALAYLPQSNALQRLLSPAEMGELFKVLVLTKEITLPEKYLTHDRSHRL